MIFMMLCEYIFIFIVHFRLVDFFIFWGTFNKIFYLFILINKETWWIYWFKFIFSQFLLFSEEIFVFVYLIETIISKFSIDTNKAKKINWVNKEKI